MGHTTPICKKNLIQKWAVSSFEDQRMIEKTNSIEQWTTANCKNRTESQTWLSWYAVEKATQGLAEGQEK